MAGMAEYFAYRFENTEAGLEALHKELEENAFFAGLSPRVRYTVGLAADELVSNLVKYCEPAAVRVRMEITGLDAGGAEVLLIDDGPPFDPLTVQPPLDIGGDIESLEIGGRGIAMVRRAADIFGYEYRDGENRVRIVKSGSE